MKRIYMLVYFAQNLNEHHATVDIEKPRLFPNCVEDFTLEVEWDGHSEYVAALNAQAKTKAAEMGFTIVGIS